MPIIYKEPRIKRFAYLREARQPINTFTNFFDSIPKLGKKKKKKIKEPVIIVHEEKPVEARAQQPNSRWNTGKSRTKRVKIKLKGKKKVSGIQISVQSKEPKKEESLENYKKRLNFNFTNKKHYGRFTQNPRQTGRELEPVSNELTNTETSTTTHVTTKKIGNMP
jgi:hypothetical protein